MTWLESLWSHNKNWLKPVTELAAGMIPIVGPYAAAGLGAAYGGLDRPHQQSFKGLGIKDLGNAALGGVTGYGLGSVGAGLGGAAGIGSGEIGRAHV